MNDDSYKEWKPWIWHKGTCRVTAMSDHLADKCTCGLAEKLAAIKAEDPREKGLTRDDINAMG